MHTNYPTAVRKAELAELVEVLKAQHEAKHDLVVPARQLRSEWGQIVVPRGDDPIVTEAGVTTELRVDVSDRMLQGIVSKVDTIDVRSMRNLRAKASEQIGWATDGFPVDPDGGIHEYSDWMRLVDDTINVPFDNDPRSFLLRTFLRADGTAFGRCLLSDRFGIFDSYDAVLAAADAIREVDPTARVDSCDLTESNMRIRWVSDSITALAPRLLDGYRTPFERPGHWGHGHGQEGLRDEHGNLPIVHAGFELSNSETGQGRFVLRPRLVVRVCNNGMVIDRLKIAKTHLGSKLEAGLIQWSAETQRANVELIKSSTRDAVRTFMNPEFLTARIAEIEDKADAPVDKPQKTIERVAKELAFTEAEADDILSFFIDGGQRTAGGVLNAVTAMCQTVEDADRAAEIESAGIRAMEIAAAA